MHDQTMLKMHKIKTNVHNVLVKKSDYTEALKDAETWEL